MPSLIYEAELPQALMSLERGSLSIAKFRCATVRRPLKPTTFDRPISWNHHVTFGPPFLEADVTTFDMPATHSKVCPASIQQADVAASRCELSVAQRTDEKEGGTARTRTSARGKYRHCTAHLLDPEIEHTFIAVGNPRLRLLVLTFLIERIIPG